MGNAPVCGWDVPPVENGRSGYCLLGERWQESAAEVGRPSGTVVERMASWEVFPFLPNDKRWLTAKDVPQPAVLGTPDGLPDKVDRIRACGNAVLPLVGAYAWRIIEDSLKV